MTVISSAPPNFTRNLPDETSPKPPRKLEKTVKQDQIDSVKERETIRDEAKAQEVAEITKSIITAKADLAMLAQANQQPEVVHELLQ